MSNSPSKTCLYVAAGRALGAREPDESIRNPDYLAELLFGPDERAMVADQPVVQALEHDFTDVEKNPDALGSMAMMIVRTRFIEQRMEQAILGGASQVVILGAGFDTRAYRLKELLKATRVFEVDQPSTQEYKKRRIRETGIEVPPNLTYVANDFRYNKLGDVLAAAGYDSTCKTFFIWEGVTMYLPEEAVKETFRWVAAQASGSTIVFDYVEAKVIKFITTADLTQLPEAAQQAIGRLRKLEAGEPWIFGIPDAGEREFLAQLGLELREQIPISGEETSKRFLTRSDGTPYLTLPPRPPGYWLAEALVV